MLCYWLLLLTFTVDFCCWLLLLLLLLSLLLDHFCCFNLYGFYHWSPFIISALPICKVVVSVVKGLIGCAKVIISWCDAVVLCYGTGIVFRREWMERDFRSAHFVENEQSCALSALEFTISSCARSLTLTLCPVKTEPSHASQLTSAVIIILCAGEYRWRNVESVDWNWTFDQNLGKH